MLYILVFARYSVVIGCHFHAMVRSTFPLPWIKIILVEILSLLVSSPKLNAGWNSNSTSIPCISARVKADIW